MSLIFRLALRHWRTRPAERLLSMVLLAAIWALAFGAFVAGQALKAARDRLERGQETVVFLSDAAEGSREKLSAEVGEKFPGAMLRWVERAEFKDRLQRESPELAQEITALGAEGEALVPLWARVSGVSEDQRAPLEQWLKARPEVDSVDGGHEQARELLAGYATAEAGLSVLAVVLLASAMMSASAWIRSQADRDRDIVRWMELWGADGLQLRIPSVISAFLFGACALAIGAALWLSFAPSAWRALQQVAPALRAAFSIPSAVAAVEPATTKLLALRHAIAKVEDEVARAIAESVGAQSQAQETVRKLTQLAKLQRQELAVAALRSQELERAVQALDSRKSDLDLRIDERKSRLRSLLKRAARMRVAEDRPEIRHVMNRLAQQELRELEAFRIDKADAERLALVIAEERQLLANLAAESKERSGLLELNRQVQLDLAKRRIPRSREKWAGLQRLRQTEREVERLLTAVQSRDVLSAEYAQWRGRLLAPVLGGVRSAFGLRFDPASGVERFRRGVELDPGDGPVRAPASGRVAYSGAIDGMGEVVVIDHGRHFLTLTGQLSARSRKVGDSVKAGEVIGSAVAHGKPVYFEVRARNVALDPLQWFSN